MSKKLQYPNKGNLLKLASEKYTSTTYTLCSFRKFNTKNSTSKQIFALSKRLEEHYPDTWKKRVIVLCYLLKGRSFTVPTEVIKKVEEKFPNYQLITEKELTSVKSPLS